MGSVGHSTGHCGSLWPIRLAVLALTLTTSPGSGSEPARIATAHPVAAASGASALEPATAMPTTYAIRHWGTVDGLPAHSIKDIRQGSDLYLWLATTAGLVRFDGHRFTVFDHKNAGLANPRLANVRLTSAGGISVMVEDSSWLESASRTAPRFSPPGSSGRRPGMAVADKLGRYWRICAKGADVVVCQTAEDGSTILTHQRVARGARVQADGKGDLWVRLASGEAGRLEGDTFRPLGSAQPFDSLITVPSRQEVLIARANGPRTELLDADSRIVASYESSPGWTPYFVDRFGNLWWISPDQVRVTRPHSGPVFWSHTFVTGTAIIAMTEDVEGDVWIGTMTDGLYRITPVPFRVYGEEAGIGDTGVSDICPAADETLLLRTWRQTNYLLHAGRAEMIKDLPEPRLFFRDHFGTSWTPGSTHAVDVAQHLELIGRTPSGEKRIVTLRSTNEIPCVFSRPGSGDVLWARDGSGVYRITDLQSARPTVKRVVGGVTETISDFRQVWPDRDGGLWIASSNGLHRDRDGARTDYTVKDGLPTNLIRSIHEDAEGTLWFGTYGAGLVRLKEGRFQILDASRGLAEDIVNTILEDRSGNFWMAGNRAISRVPRRDIEAVLDGRTPRVAAIQYGRQAGLVNPESSGLAGASDSSGRFWFPTFYGAAVVDPATALALEQTPVRVLVERVSNVPREATPEEGGFVVPASSQRLTVAFTAIALRDPENVQLQYRLDGFDTDWIGSGADRIATYTHLPPGGYRFRVRAFTPPGRWVEAETPVSLRVLPAFHQTRGFQALVGLAAVGLVLAVFRARTRYLKRRAERLEQTVVERTSDLAREKETVARQVEQLQELERAKSRFFANVSHEFRTPLTLIQGPLEDLQEGLHGPLTEDAREQIDVATRSSHRLLHLVDQLLDIARAESGRLSLRARRGDYRLFLRRIVGSLMPLAERKGVTLEVEGPESALPLWFDPEHLEKVLLNVIGNALKFTPAGGHVTVRVRVEGDSDETGWIFTAVEDDGPGISGEDLPRIFDRFHRGGGVSRSQPGAGIGLALAKELLVLHGGTIQAESREGEGSVFSIRLPRGRAHLADAELAPEDETDLLHPVGGATDRDAIRSRPDLPARTAGAIEELRLEGAARAGADDRDLPAGLGLDKDITTILVADDNAEVRAYVRAHLERRYRVVEAVDGREALEVARRALPDVVVSDVMMPIMDGFALCRAIKSDPEVDYIPVILLTARASSDSRIEGLQEGADDYLTKPFNVRELEARIDNLIASRRRLRDRFAAGMAVPSSMAADVAAPLTGAEAGVGHPYVFAITPGHVNIASADAAFLDQARAAIEAHLGDEDFDADALARAIGASRTTLYRRLKELLGESPMGLIRKVRLEQAASFLERGNGTIGEIAYAVGFRSFAHFSSSFKEHHGATPSAYRRAPREPRREPD